MKSTTLQLMYNKVYEEGTHAAIMYQKVNDYYKKAWLDVIHKTIDILEKIEEVQDCVYEPKKSKFDKAVEVVAEEIKEDLNGYYSDWGITSNDMWD